METGLRAVSEWLSRNLLTINANKTNFLCFHKTSVSGPHSTPVAKIHNCDSAHSPTRCRCPEISRSETTKYLGVILDENLSFRGHIEHTAKRVRKLVSVMKHLRGAAEPKTTKLVYAALCQPLLAYCISAWGGATKDDLITLERAQRAVLKVMLGRPRRYSTELILNEAQVLSVRKLYLLRLTLLEHATLGKTGMYLSLRRKRVFTVPKPTTHTAFARRFVWAAAPHIYNLVAKYCDIVSTNRYVAKNLVTKWLLLQDYDNIERMLKRVV